MKCLFLVFLCACGPEQADLVSRLGTKHATAGMGVEMAQIDLQEAQLISYWSAHGISPETSREAIKGFPVQWVDEPGFPCRSKPGETCLGETFGGVIKVAYSRCQWMTAYRHELTHVILFWATLDSDPGHTRKEWDEVDNLPGFCVTYQSSDLSERIESRGY